uniref:BZIP domain-containing protein n=1 Tax=Triticum urartu TaxID=4572 RepID=A0A8R7R886_TRIUA
MCCCGGGRGGGHHLLAPRGRPRRVDAALEGQRAAVVRSRGEGGDGLAGGCAGEADAVVALWLRGQQEQGAMGPRQPRVSARLQRRVRLRRVHQRRRGRRLLLAPGHRRGHAVVTPTAAPASSSLAKVGSAGGARRTLILPVPPARTAGQRSRKKMRLPEVKQLVLSLSAENVGLRQEMESLQRACTGLSKENGRLETRLEHSSSSSKRKRTGSEEEERRQRKPQQAGGGFELPDLNIPAQDVADAPAAVP